MKSFLKDNREPLKDMEDEVSRKKILYILSEVSFDLIVFDCIEDGYIN